ncbi:DNA-processing protein DprA [Leptolyngbya sp. 15MV]|nr:DNA-processing protein DprA [Leptolyngbya sp. 15MV]
MKTWIALNMTPGVGPAVAAKLIARFGSPDGVFQARRAELESLRIKPETIESLMRREFAEKALEEYENVKRLGGDILVLDDGSYPTLLREIADPPITLYVKGDWRACFDAPCVGVIGSRMCST